MRGGRKSCQTHIPRHRTKTPTDRIFSFYFGCFFGRFARNQELTGISSLKLGFFFWQNRKSITPRLLYKKLQGLDQGTLDFLRILGVVLGVLGVVLGVLEVVLVVLEVVLVVLEVVLVVLVVVLMSRCPFQRLQSAGQL